MKKTIIFMWLILAFTYNLQAQDSVNNFSSENNKIIWQKVFETNLDFNQLTDKIKESGILEKIEIGENKILGQSKPIEADFKGAGYSEMSTPMYIARSFFDGFVMIEFKDGKYRVTFKNIMLTQKYNDGLSKEGEKTTIETFGLKSGKNEFKGAFTKSPSKILNYTFTKSFDFKSLDKNDNW
ncbi:MAG TPA: hypothetical protein VKY44_01960 [Flavobacterium sp.]|nr:hypothetical protein [Flavobacterium sp.]